MPSISPTSVTQNRNSDQSSFDSSDVTIVVLIAVLLMIVLIVIGIIIYIKKYKIVKQDQKGLTVTSIQTVQTPTSNRGEI